MAFATLNNFKTPLTTELLAGETGVFVDIAESARIDALTPSTARPVKITLDDGEQIEVVHCITVNTTTGRLGVVREKEGTASPASFAVGTSVEARVTAGHFNHTQSVYVIPESSGSVLVNTGDHQNFYIDLTGATSLYITASDDGYQRLTVAVKANGENFSLFVSGVNQAVLDSAVFFPISGVDICLFSVDISNGIAMIKLVVESSGGGGGGA